MSEKERRDECIKELESMGYYARNLWHVNDVQQNHNLNDEQALSVLDDVMTSEYVVSNIFELIDIKVEQYEG